MPRANRIQNLQNEKSKRTRQAADQNKKKEDEAAKFAKQDRLNKANHGAFNEVLPKVELWLQVLSSWWLPSHGLLMAS